MSIGNPGFRGLGGLRQRFQQQQTRPIQRQRFMGQQFPATGLMGLQRGFNPQIQSLPNLGRIGTTNVSPGQPTLPQPLQPQQQQQDWTNPPLQPLPGAYGQGLQAASAMGVDPASLRPMVNAIRPAPQQPIPQRSDHSIPQSVLDARRRDPSGLMDRQLQMKRAMQAQDGWVPGGGPQRIQQPTVQDQVAALPAGFARPSSATPVGGGGGGGGGGEDGGGGVPTSWKMEITPAATGGLIGYEHGGLVSLRGGGEIPMIYANGGYVPAYFLGGLFKKDTWSKVGKGLLKAAPVAAMFIPGIGPITAGAIGGLSGALSKKVEGGSWSDSLQKGIMSGLVSAGGRKAVQGVHGGFTKGLRRYGEDADPGSYEDLYATKGERLKGGFRGALEGLSEAGRLASALGPGIHAMESGHGGGDVTVQSSIAGPAQRRAAAPAGAPPSGSGWTSQGLFSDLQNAPTRTAATGGLYARRHFRGGPVRGYEEGGEVWTAESRGEPVEEVTAGGFYPGGIRYDEASPFNIFRPIPYQFDDRQKKRAGKDIWTDWRRRPDVEEKAKKRAEEIYSDDDDKKDEEESFDVGAIEQVVPNAARDAALAAAAARHGTTIPTDMMGVTDVTATQMGFDDEGPIDETEQQATQQHFGTRTVDVETPSVEPPSGPIDWGQTATTFDLEPGDEGMPPVGEDIYGHGREGQEDAEGSAELPPDVSRTDVIRDSARDKGLDTLAEIEAAEPGVADIITKPEEDAAELNLEQSLVTKPQGIEQGDLASVYAQNQRDLAQAQQQQQQQQQTTPRSTDPEQVAQQQAQQKGPSLFSQMTSGAHQQAIGSPFAGGTDPNQMPTTAAQFEQAGNPAAAGLLNRINQAPTVQNYIPTPPPVAAQEGGLIRESAGDDAVPNQVLEAVANAVRTGDQETVMAFKEAVVPDVFSQEQFEQLIQQIESEAMDEMLMAGPPEAMPMAPPVAPMQTGGLVPGNGDGMADDILVTADAGTPQAQDVAIGSGEFVVAADVVSGLGSGNTDRGAEVLEQLQDDVRVQRTGTPQQPPPIDLSDVLPGTYGEQYA